MFIFTIFYLMTGIHITIIQGFLFYPRKCSFGYLAAVAMPLDIPNRNIYVAFNFESNYALPSNDTYNQWIDRWKLDETFLGIGNNVTAINGRSDEHLHSRYTRSTFYHAIMGYLKYFQFNAKACLLRIICEIANYEELDKHNGVLGTLFKILFLPSSSRPETKEDLIHLHTPQDIDEFHLAEEEGLYLGHCNNYKPACPVSPLDLISKWL